MHHDVVTLFRRAAETTQGVTFVAKDGQADTASYRDLFDRASRFAAALQSRAGFAPGQVIAIFSDTGPAFYHAYLGTILAGCVPVAMYPPAKLGDVESWAQRTSRMLESVACAAIAYTAEFRHVLAAKLGAYPLLSVAEQTAAHSPLRTFTARDPDETAFLQFSSGSTGLPKPIRISHRNLLTNVRGMVERMFAISDTRVTCGWLPLYHDMGLVGLLFNCLYGPTPLVLMKPVDFLARPALWLETLSRFKADFTVAPNFSFGLCTRRIKDADMQGWDLSHLKVALCGAERVDRETLAKFSEKFAAVGFHGKAFAPVYGLAEATLAATFPSAGFAMKSLCVGRGLITSGEKLALAAQGDTYLSVGRANEGVDIGLFHADAAVAADLVIGEIHLRGPSICRNEGRAEEAWLATGDLGFFHQGDLYVCGRKKEVIVYRGRNIDPTFIEQSCYAVPEIRTGRAIAFGVMRQGEGTDALVVLAELTTKVDAAKKQELTRKLKAAVLDEHNVAPDQVLLFEPGTLPRTSSGKLKRVAAKEQYQNGTLEPAVDYVGNVMNYLRISYQKVRAWRLKLV